MDAGATLAVLACRIALATVVSLALLAVVPNLFGLTSTVVMSGSMAPGIRAGDVVVVRAVPAADLHVGQVLLVDDPSFPGRLRLHRLAARAGGELVLKGDANAQRDPTPVPVSAVHGAGFLRVPWIGLPVLWARTGDPGLAALALAGIVAAAAVVALLDDGSGGPIVRVVRAARRLRPGRRARLVGCGAVLLLGTSAAVHGGDALGRGAWASFTSTSTSPSDAFAAGTWCPALPKAVVTGATTATPPDIAYSFAQSGTTETSVGALGSGYSAVLSTAALRATGSCSGGGATPAVRFAGGESIVSTQGYPANQSATESLWFDPSSATGVLADLGGSTASAASADRQLYFTSSGGLSFVVRNGSTPVGCSITSSVALNTWHFVALVYNGSAKSFTVYYDGQTASCSGTFTTAPTTTLRLRIGNDATIATDAAGGSYTGLVDEVYTWGATMPASSIGAVLAGGH